VDDDWKKCTKPLLKKISLYQLLCLNQAGTQNSTGQNDRIKKKKESAC